MNDARIQHYPGPQYEVRFEARAPLLDEAIVGLEKPDSNGMLPPHIFFYAMKRIAIDLSDTYDGKSRSLAEFTQWRHQVKQQYGSRLQGFRVDPDSVNEFRDGGRSGKLVGVGLHIQLDQMMARTILSGPFYGVKTLVSEEERKASIALNEQVAELGIPVRYEIQNLTGDEEEALDRLRMVVKSGVKLTQLTVVDPLNEINRTANVFGNQPLGRTFERIDAYIEDHPRTLPEPIDLLSRSPQAKKSIKNAS